MPGPRDSDLALRWIQQALVAGRYIVSGHFGERLAERHVTMMDVHAAVATADSISKYERGAPRNGGTCWRVVGRSIDEDRIAVGIEAFLDKKRKYVILCTVFCLEVEDGT